MPCEPVWCTMAYGSRGICCLGMVIAVVGFVALCLEGMTTNTATVDEFAHVPAGLSHWETGDFSLYHENPPFVRCLVSFPVWCSGPVTRYRKALVGEGLRREWEFAVDYLLANLDDYTRLLFMARGVVLALSLTCCGVIFIWSGQEYGWAAGCVGSILWLTDPNIIAHSGVATLDVGAATAACLSSFMFWRFLRGPTWPGAILSGIGLGVAASSKFTLLMLYPAWGLAFVLSQFLQAEVGGDRGHSPAARPSWIQAVSIITLSVLSIDACYLFKGVGRRLDSYGFVSRLFTGAISPLSRFVPGPPGENRLRGTVIGRMPVPLPEDYVIGLDSQKRDEESGLANMCEGRLVEGGFWYSPLRTLIYKLPPGTIVLLGSAAMFWVRRGRRGSLTLKGLVIILPALTILGGLCTQTGLNWAFRYAIPALPFLFIAVGAMVSRVWSLPAARALILLCVGWNIADVALTRPFHFSYGNLLIGGMRGAQKVFLGSNYDWGQDLGRLKLWSQANPDKTPRTFVLFYGSIEPRIQGVIARLGFPDAKAKDHFAAEDLERNRPYYFAISSNFLNGMPCTYRSLEGAPTIGTLVLDNNIGSWEVSDRVGGAVFILKVDDYKGQIYVKNYESRGKVPGTP